jgi:hypothetical protein
LRQAGWVGDRLCNKLGDLLFDKLGRYMSNLRAAQ